MANTKMNFSSCSLYLVLFFIISLNFLLSSAETSMTSASKIALSQSMHIVYTTERPSNLKPRAFNLQILTSVLGSFALLDVDSKTSMLFSSNHASYQLYYNTLHNKEAAKKALVYSFENSMSGFVAKLTPDQVKKILEQPGVVHAMRSVSYNLTGGKKNPIV